jgi:hypothetical protein
MKDTGAISDREELHVQVNKLTSSSILHGSESLCKLLRFLAEHSLDQPGTPIKEYQIATEVFGRPADFDPRLDSTVRVQTGRLRSKLAEYYSSEGAGDRLVVEIPKGAYTLTYHSREPEPAPAGMRNSAAPPAALPAPPLVTPSPYPLSWFFLSIIIGALVVVVLAIAVIRFMQPAAATDERPPAALRSFWNPFMSSPDESLVVYSNAEFVGRPETGLRYFNPATDRGLQILDHYTGVGEVMAVHDLDLLFTSFHHPIRIKRGMLLTWDDAKSSDLIFLGSPSENLSLRDLTGSQDFVFARRASAPRQGDLMISNLHRRPGEAAAYLASEPPITEDYALIALTSGLNPARRVLILAGITTFGTQAAAEFVCHAPRVAELLSRLPARGRRFSPFEALLRIKVNGGVPVHADLVAVHVHNGS